MAEILHAHVQRTWLIIHVKCFLHPLQSNRQTDRRTDDNHANSSTVS